MTVQHLVRYLDEEPRYRHHQVLRSYAADLRRYQLPGEPLAQDEPVGRVGVKKYLRHQTQEHEVVIYGALEDFTYLRRVLVE